MTSLDAASVTDDPGSTGRQQTGAGRGEPGGASDNGPLLPIVARRHVGRWVSAAVALVLVAMFVSFIVTNPNWQWSIVGDYLFAQVVMQGLLLTVILTVVSTAIGLVLGAVTAFMRLSANPTFRIAASIYIWFIRSIPPLVLLLLIFFLAALLPRISLGVPFGPEVVSFSTNDLITRFTAAVVGLGLYLGAYTGEILRGGILAVPRGQFEAAQALGMTDTLLVRRIVSPQAIRVIIPAMANEVITMFKATSLVTVIGAAELLTTVQLIYARTFEIIPLLMVACLWYLFITSIAMLGQSRLEEKFGRGYTRSSPTTPAWRAALRRRRRTS